MKKLDQYAKEANSEKNITETVKETGIDFDKSIDKSFSILEKIYDVPDMYSVVRIFMEELKSLSPDDAMTLLAIYTQLSMENEEKTEALHQLHDIAAYTLWGDPDDQNTSEVDGNGETHKLDN